MGDRQSVVVAVEWVFRLASSVHLHCTKVGCFCQHMVNEYYALGKLPILSSQQVYVLLRVYNVTMGISMVQMEALSTVKNEKGFRCVFVLFSSVYMMIRLSKHKKSEPTLVKKHSRSIASIIHI